MIKIMIDKNYFVYKQSQLIMDPTTITNILFTLKNLCDNDNLLNNYCDLKQSCAKIYSKN